MHQTADATCAWRQYAQLFRTHMPGTFTRVQAQYHGRSSLRQHGYLQEKSIDAPLPLHCLAMHAHLLAIVLPSLSALSLCLLQVVFASSYRRSPLKRPASAAVSSSAAAASGVGVAPAAAALPAYHWFDQHHHKHRSQHPHLQQDLMSIMHFSRPRSAPHKTSSGSQRHCSNSHTHQPAAGRRHADAAIARGNESNRVQHAAVDGGTKESAVDSSLAGVGVTGTVDGEGLGRQYQDTGNDSPESSAVQASQRQDGDSSQQLPLDDSLQQTRVGDEGSTRQLPGCELRGTCSVDHVIDDQSGWENRAGDRQESNSRRDTDKQEDECERQSRWQEGQHGRVKGKQQQCWPAEGIRWRAAMAYKLQAGPMHRPTAKVSIDC